MANRHQQYGPQCVNGVCRYLCVANNRADGHSGFTVAPAMGLFGLPGEAAMVLFAAWMSMGGGVGVASSLFLTGKLTATSVAILAPAMYLMGSQLQFMGRLLGVTGTKGKCYPAMFAICVLNAVIALWIMNLIV